VKKIGGGLMGTIYDDGTHVVKIIHKNPRDRYGDPFPREYAIANERRAIAYNQSCPEEFRLFPETTEIAPGKFRKEKLFPVDIEKTTREEKLRFGAAIIHMLRSGFGLVDGIQVMANEDGRLFICDADSFIEISELPVETQNRIAYGVNFFIARKLGIGVWITRYCTIEKTIAAFEKGKEGGK